MCQKDDTAGAVESSKNGGEQSYEIPVRADDTPAPVVADGGEDETPSIIEYLRSADNQYESAPVKQYINYCGGRWQTGDGEYLDEEPDDYRAECAACGEAFETFSQAERHVETCGDDEPVLMTDGGVDTEPDPGRSKVRFVSFYEDPSLEDHQLLIRYTADTPREEVYFFNFETEERRTCTLVGYGSTGGWVPRKEAEAMTEDIYVENLESEL